MKTMVLLSGGMDSCVALAQCISEGLEVEAVSFNYGQRHVRELDAAREIAKCYGIEHTVLDLTGAMKAFEGSALTGGGDVPEGHYEDSSMKQTVVPNRNLSMLSLAAGLAISHGCELLVYAAHAGDHQIYPDCRIEFIEAAAEAIKAGNYDGPELRAPFVDLSKAEIASLGATLGAPFELTWSCYNGGTLHCSVCSTCRERRWAFLVAGVTDPTTYDPSGFEKVPDKLLLDRKG